MPISSIIRYIYATHSKALRRLEARMIVTGAWVYLADSDRSVGCAREPRWLINNLAGAARSTHPLAV